eukprot:GILJ01000700.1.p1 GENE.GILJ01000700.1~~GILJ01000700.1.p1  ORF type:complete len:506 (+),score=92.99 GILJ01000700.1:73-1518(+)
MKDRDSTEPSTQTLPAVKEQDPVVTAVNDIKSSVSALEKAVVAKDSRLVGRVVRNLSSLRKKLSSAALLRVLRLYSVDDLANLQDSLARLSMTDAPMTVDSNGKGTSCPEVEVYLQTLALVFFIDRQQLPEAMSLSSALLEKLKAYNRRTMDSISSKVFFYYARAFELAGRASETRSTLLACYRTASLHHDELGQATLLNLLLRNYISNNLFEQAHKLVSKTSFPEGRSNNQSARYLYYLGRIKAVQLEYSDAYAQLTQALRKAPQNSATGFRLAVIKMQVIVQLLMGEIPERNVFAQSGLRQALKPYFLITQAVRTGDLSTFHDVTSRFANIFQTDNTVTLINRLRHNVIKTGLRRINLSYSRISLADVAKKLKLDSAADAECIVAKAIRDGVIEATINHNESYLQSKETVDLYSTQEPQLAFHKRISFCLNIHNDAVKAMTFPPDAHKEELESSEQRRERLQQEQELAQNLADEDEDEL